MENEVPPVYSCPPPLITPPPPPATPKKNRGWKIAALILAVVLAVSLLNDFGHFLHGLKVSAKTSRHSGRWLEEVTIENNGSANRIVVLNVDGIITSMALDRSGRNMVSLIKDELNLAADDSTVKAVILKVDSPGGEVLASDEIYRTISDFQKKSGKPVIAAMEGLAASGGYYVSAPCQWIVANEMTLTGSIGVIMHSYNYRGLMDKVGVRPEVFKSGKFKDMLSGDKLEVSPEERQMIQSLIDETFTRFKKVVADGRRWANRKNKGDGQTLANDWEDYADGRVLSGKQAFELGFVDELGNFDAAVKRAQDLARISNANLIRYEQPFDLSNLFRLFGKAETKSIKIDLGMDLPKLQIGRLYFLSPTFLH